MAIAHGFESILGVGAESTVGTPVVVTDKVPFRSEDLNEMFNQVQDNSLCGPAARPKPQQGTGIVEGSIEYHLRYTQNQLLLKTFFGTYLTDTPVVGTNTYSLDPNIDGSSLTVAIDKQVSVWEFAGWKPSELTISGSNTEGIIIEADGMAISLDLASALNTTGVLSGLSVSEDIVLFQDVTLRIGDLADALDSSDDLSVSEFEININRALEATEVNSRNRLEALENAFRETTLEITIPRYELNTFINFHKNHTQLQASLSVSDGTNTIEFLIPNMLVMEYEAAVEGPEFVPHAVTFTAHPDTNSDNSFISLNDSLAEIEIRESA